MKKLCTYLFIITTVLVNKANAQRAGNLDSTFNKKGFNVTQRINHTNDVFAVATQADGRAIVTGFIQYSDTEKLVVQRYKTDGTLDNTFNNTGIFYFVTGSGYTCRGEAIAIQNDGKIIIGGYAFMTGNQEDFLLLRLNTNGTLDNTFGVNGVVTLDFTDGQQDEIYSLAIQPDGKILAAGAAVVNGNFCFAMVRCNADGSFDNTFGQDSRVYTPLGTGASLAGAIGLQADGKIVLGGFSENGDKFIVSTICRYTNAGIIDNTFDLTGIVTTQMSEFDNQISALAIQPDGKIVTSGYAKNANNYGDFALARYNTDGTLDSTFNGNGKVTTDFTSMDDEASTINLQPDGKIIACGYALIDVSQEFALARYNSNGTLDNSFGNNGITSTQLGNIFDAISGSALQPDGKLVVAGFSRDSTNSNMVVARYLTGASTGILNFNTPANQYLIYPNPATENTQLEYELQNTETISVAVFDVTGKLVSAVLNNQTQTAGKHSLTIHFGSQLAAGTYFVRITSNSGQVSIKMVKG